MLALEPLLRSRGCNDPVDILTLYHQGPRPAPCGAATMTKFVFVTGGVVSSLGKGIAAASLAAIL